MSKSVTRGVGILREPSLNKGTAFSIRERQILGIHGLLPPAVSTPDVQVQRCLENLKRKPTDLDRYVYLINLQDRNEKLFYKLVTSHVQEMMPLIYTPVVGLACQNYGLVFTKPRGLFITIHDRSHVRGILDNWPATNVKAIVVTDGERILGLGDLGCYGMGIPVGKLSLYTALAGVPPENCLPICLDVGTNNKKLIEDPYYIGLKQPRVTGQEYDDFIEEFMRACVDKYSSDVLIQFEDFGNHNAFRLLEKYRHDYCTFNDDIQGTASVAVGGILAAAEITKKKLTENKYMFFGAGEASLGIAGLIVFALEKMGLSHAEAKKHVFLLDSRGLIVKNRPKGGLTPHKEVFAQDMAPIDTLEEAIEKLRPNVLIGAAAIPGKFSPEILKLMAKINERPVIFALSNPTSKAECTANEAYTHTEGRCIFASGSPFDPVQLNGHTFEPGQGNNSYIFPGVALAVVTGLIHPIEEDVFLIAAQTLAKQVSKDDLNKGRVYPHLNTIREVSLEIAAAVLQFAYDKKQAFFWPEPKDKKQFIKSRMYSLEYDDLAPAIYDIPQANL